MSWIDERITFVEQRYYGGEMPSQNKSVLRKMLAREDAFWELKEISNWLFQKHETKTNEVG